MGVILSVILNWV